MRYSLRQVEVFLAAAQYENISKAADSLAMSQSAASSSLRDLESQFDVQLFDRLGKRLQLNALGRSMRPKAESLLAQANEFQRELSQHTEIGDLRLGASLTIGNYLAVAMMAEFMSGHENTNVHLQVANTKSIVERVANYDLDVGLIEGEIFNQSLNILPWLEDDVTVFCSPDHPLAKKELLSDEDLVSVDWVVREQGSGTRQAFNRAMQGILSDAHIRYELEHSEAIKRAVEANLGIGCLSEITLAGAFSRGELVKLSAPHRQWHRHFYIVVHKDKYHTPVLDSWLTFCEDYKVN